MKKLFVLLAAVVISAGVATAQNNAVESGRTIKMPEEKGHSINDYGTRNSGFWNAFELQGGYSVNHGHSNIGLVEFDYVAGYRFNEYLRVGAGIGARYYPKSSDLRYTSWKWSFPLFFNVRGNITSGQYRTVVPYYSLDAGASLHDGFMFRPTVGIRIGDYNNSAFLVGVSYLGQSLKVAKTNADGAVYRDNYLASFITLKLGYEF